MNKSVPGIRVVALSGQTGAGKSSLARELKRRLPVCVASFGAFVRAQARRRGQPLDVPSLQSLGQELIDQLGPEEFVWQVIDWAQSIETRDIATDAVIVLDGVRSQDIWHAVQRMAAQSVLVYLDIDEKTRVERIVRRSDVDLPSLRRAFSHPMEANVPELRPDADLILGEGNIDTWTDRVIQNMASRGIELPD